MAKSRHFWREVNESKNESDRERESKRASKTSEEKNVLHLSLAINYHFMCKCGVHRMRNVCAYMS